MDIYFSNFIDWLNDLLWGSVLVYLLVGVGIYFTIRLGVIQLRHFGHMFTILKGSRSSDSSGISSFQAFCTGLAARVGAGNMAGVAVAITAGGPGAVFWMWVIAMIGMATAFAESALAQLYKTRDEKGEYCGGPAYYMEKGLGLRSMGIVFAIFLIIAFGLVFNAVQANTVAGAMNTAFDWNHTYVGIVLVLVSGAVIFGGIRAIARTAEILVPVMATFYIILALVVTIANFDRIDDAIVLIVKSAFGWQEAAAGGVAFSIMKAVQTGAARGLFSNEAGMGSAPNAAAAATPNPPHPASQGYVQMFGVFIDTIVICSATVAIVLLSGVDIPYAANNVEGIALTQAALTSQVGGWGSTFIAIAVLFFCFTSIIANYSYAESNIVFIFRGSVVAKMIFRVMVLGMVMLGAVLKIGVVWNMADASMGLMAIVNLIALIMLSGVVIKLAKDYQKQLNAGKIPTFDINDFPELKDKIEPGIWDKK